ncbi:MAG: aminodeoxychorismate lyase [Thiomicrospira sp.]|nr:aminodeoxychorismate lyase [Thiomicrospira sp.]
MNQQAWLNGEPIQQVSVWERGLLYGDGFFTTMLCYRQQLMNWPAHWARIETSLARLQFGQLQQAALREQLVPVLDAAPKQGAAIIKLLLSRGVGGRGYAAPLLASPHCIAYLHSLAPDLQIQPHPLPPLKALRVRFCQTPASQNTFLAGLKHLNRLDNVLARQEVEASGFDEGLMCDSEQRVIGGTQGNLVLLNGNQALTPNLNRAGIQGTCLSRLRALDLGLEWIETDLTRADLARAQVAFLCNAVRGVQAIASLDGRCLNIEPIKRIQQAWWRDQFSMIGWGEHD